VNWILFSFFCLLLDWKKKGMLQLRFWASFKQISLNTNCSAQNGSYSTHWLTKHSSLWPVLYRAIWSALQYFLMILYTYSIEHLLNNKLHIWMRKFSMGTHEETYLSGLECSTRDPQICRFL
jgi:hypothetical protein